MSSHVFRSALDGHDLDGVVAALADDVVFHSPVISGRAFKGRRSVRALYKIVLSEFVGLAVSHEFVDGPDHVLLANANVRGHETKLAVHFVTDEDERIREMWVMARPLHGSVAIVEAIGSGFLRSRGMRAAQKALAREIQVQVAAINRVASRIIDKVNDADTRRIDDAGVKRL